MNGAMNFADWVQSVPTTLTKDPLWPVEAYRLATFRADLGWGAVSALAADRRTRGLADQLYRSLGSVGANIAEGYSRGSTRDRARFYEYALGSAREARDWYYKGRYVLGEQTAADRMEKLSQVVRLLLSMVRSQRGYAVHESVADYDSLPQLYPA
jgi:four helix bundle protein